MAEERHLPKGLGSYYGKVLRVQRVASWMCETIARGNRGAPRRRAQGRLSGQGGLTTELVKEFTELQGIVEGCSQGQH